MSKETLVRPMTKSEIRESGWAGWMGDERLFFVKDTTASENEVMEELAKIAMRDKDGAYIVHNTYQGHRVVGWGYTPKGYANTIDRAKLHLVALEGDKKQGVQGYNPVCLRPE